jgi:ketosteroid isomerase-like protein
MAFAGIFARSERHTPEEKPTWTDKENVALASQYLEALESGPAGDELAQFFAPEVVLEIFPGKFSQNGSRDDLAGILAAAERGEKVTTSQKYEIRNEVATGDKVALEIDWTGTLAAAFPTIPKGVPKAAHFAAFLEFKDGKTASQRNYDCYEP